MLKGGMIDPTKLIEAILTEYLRAMVSFSDRAEDDKTGRDFDRGRSLGVKAVADAFGLWPQVIDLLRTTRNELP